MLAIRNTHAVGSGHLFNHEPLLKISLNIVPNQIDPARRVNFVLKVVGVIHSSMINFPIDIQGLVLTKLNTRLNIFMVLLKLNGETFKANLSGIVRSRPVSIQ